MNEIVVLVYPDGHKSVKYDSHDALWHEVIDYYTIKQVTDEQLEEIKTCTYDRVQLLLNRYI